MGAFFLGFRRQFIFGQRVLLDLVEPDATILITSLGNKLSPHVGQHIGTYISHSDPNKTMLDPPSNYKVFHEREFTFKGERAKALKAKLGSLWNEDGSNHAPMNGLHLPLLSPRK